MHALSLGVDFSEEGMAQYIILYLNLNAHWNENREGGGRSAFFLEYFLCLYLRDVSFNPAFVGSVSEC